MKTEFAPKDFTASCVVTLPDGVVVAMGVPKSSLDIWVRLYGPLSVVGLEESLQIEQVVRVEAAAYRMAAYLLENACTGRPQEINTEDELDGRAACTLVYEKHHEDDDYDLLKELSLVGDGLNKYAEASE